MEKKYSYYVITDATSDYPETFRPSESEFHIIPMTYFMNGVLYDGVNTPFLSIDKFYEEMDKGGNPQTALITPQLFRDNVEPVLKAGFDVLYLSFSSMMSGSCKSAQTMSEQLSAEYPERKIFVVDTLSATLGEGLLVRHVLLKRAAGAAIEEARDYAEYLKQYTVHLFMLDDLYHLYRGGRISRAAHLVGNAIQLKPVLKVGSDGGLQVTNKMVGKRLALKVMLDKMEERIKGFDNPFALIGYGTPKSDAEWLAERVTERFGIPVFIDRVGPIVGSHTGPSMLGLFFLGSPRD